MLLDTIPASGSLNLVRRYVYPFIKVGSVSSFNPISNIQVSIGGKSQISVRTQDHVTGLFALISPFINEPAGHSGSPTLLRLASGFVADETLEIDMDSSSVNPEPVYGFGIAKGVKGSYTKASQLTILANSQQEFTSDVFDYILVIDTDVDYYQVEFKDGYSEKFTTVEMRTLLGIMRITSLGCVNSDSELVSIPLDDLGIRKLSIYASTSNILVTTVTF